MHFGSSSTDMKEGQVIALSYRQLPATDRFFL